MRWIRSPELAESFRLELESCAHLGRGVKGPATFMPPDEAPEPGGHLVCLCDPRAHGCVPVSEPHTRPWAQRGDTCASGIACMP